MENMLFSISFRKYQDLKKENNLLRAVIKFSLNCSLDLCTRNKFVTLWMN